MKTRGPLTILHTESSLGWGGQEIRVRSEAMGMQRLGHRVIVAAPAHGHLFAAARDGGLEVVAVEMSRVLSGVRTMASVLRTYHPLVVNTHSSRDSWLASIAVQFVAKNAILVRTRHLSTPIARNILTRYLYGVLPDAIITTGEAIRTEMIGRHGFDPRKIVSIPTGIDLTVFSRKAADGALRRELGLSDQVPLVGTVAVLRGWKGHEDLVEAADVVLRSRPDARFLIVGDGPYRPQIEAAIAKKGLADRIVMLGYRDDVPAVLASLNVFVLSSFGHEGVPQAILQALAMEVPVVATNVGAVAEAVRDGETGFLVPPRDTAAIASRIVELLSDPGLRRMMGEKGRGLVERCFGMERMLERTIGLYDTLLESRNATTGDGDD